jgi:uncharacterized protein YbjQ (UPF0145 family)
MQIQEFMIAKTSGEEYGVIIRNEHLTMPYRIVYKSGGQIFGDNFKSYIKELYINKNSDMKNIIFDAVQFLNNPEVNIKNYNLVYSGEIDTDEEMF